MPNPYHHLYHQAAHALVPFYAADIFQAMASANLEAATYDWLIHIYGQHPTPFTLADWLTFYRADALSPELLAKLYDDGHLYEQDGGFVLTESTATWLRNHLASDQAALAAVPLPTFDLGPLVELFRRLIDQDVVKAHTRHLQGLRPAPDANPLVQIDHALTELTTTLDPSGLDALTEQAFGHDERARLMTDLGALLHHLYRHIALKILALVGEIRGQFAHLTDTGASAAMQRLNYSPNEARALATVLSLDPPTLDTFHLRRPYHNRTLLAAWWNALAGREVLEHLPDGRYMLTALGRDHVGQLFEAEFQAYERVQHFPEEQIFELHSRLTRLISSVMSDTALNTFITQTAHRLQPPYPHPLALMQQALNEIWAFRDDSHIAAWRKLDVEGYQWEALTLIWRDLAKTSDDLAQQLVARGYGALDYEVGMAKLVERGWVTGGPDGYTITDEGRRIRQQGEQDTDDVFCGAWVKLGDEVPPTYHLLSALHYGMGRILDSIRDAEPPTL